jgi:divalent metal cation (Fe/Co/Zn/Cd) transporter
VHEVDLRAGLRVSVASVAWTVSAGTIAVVLGVGSGSLVLVAFGVIGMLDAAGSSTLVVHFRHALRHEVFSERHERVALRVVTIGMVIVGVLTAAVGLTRLASGSATESSPVGAVVATASVVVLALLAVRKHRVARRIPSRALFADGWLSANGALLALVTVVGTALTSTLGWWWLDPAAGTAVAAGAIGVGFALARG